MEKSKGERPSNELESEKSKARDYARSVKAYLENAEAETILRPHQVDVFKDLLTFFENGNTRGYIDLPTGTGKTVLFVELTKALMEGKEPEDRPKVLVATPTKDLIRQTIGKSGKKGKGYGEFAPDLKVGSYFGETSAKEKRRIDEFDAVVTSYRSFDILDRSYEMIPKDQASETELEDYVKNLSKLMGSNALEIVQGLKGIPGGKLLDKFGVIILDEAHHALGSTVSSIIRSLPKDVVVIGFTATPDADEQRRLIHTLPREIHRMSLREAIQMEILAPVLPIGIKSGVKIKGSDLYDASGEFIDNRIGYLAHDSIRNNTVLEAAEILAGQSVPTIISCIAGGEAWHARYLAEKLQERGVRAEAVFSRITSRERGKIYKRFEKGEIDVLTFVGVLGEGWDSNAKAIINARPTRSPIFAPQRIGRILRPGAPAIAIDIYDDYEEGEQNPPITGADVFGEGPVEFGTAIGTIEDRTAIDTTLALLKERLPVLDRLENNYADYQTLLETLAKLHSGVTTLESGMKYAIASRVNSVYQGVTEEILERAAELSGKPLEKALAARGNVILTVFSVRDSQNLLMGLPEVDVAKYYVDQEGSKWLAPQGIVALFSKRYPDVDEEIVTTLLREEGDELEWIPGRHVVSGSRRGYFRRHAVTKLYPIDQYTIDTINEALGEYFSSS
jgi:superfamily II DNA or RNA helicase